MSKQTKKKDDLGQTPTEQTNYVTANAGFPFVYANNAFMTLSDLDGSIIFGEVVGNDEESGKTLVVPKVKVVMATPFLRKLRDLLTDTIESYDTRNSKD